MAPSFLSPGTQTSEGQLTSLHLSHSQSIPVILSTIASSAEELGYAEGVVTNTKFGSFPHSTLLGVPWGSQIRASKVDTGSRGRKPGHGAKKRKANAISKDSLGADEGGVDSPGQEAKEVTLASSGFIHVLPPTPENWTANLPHRTQVVYTPDYSYILHRIRARPGSVLIEAGSGSGSFTHAAARAVYDGSSMESEGRSTGIEDGRTADQTKGKVFSFEFHPGRHEKVKIEMKEHGLEGMVTATHRDVYKDGFSIQNEDGSWRSPSANAIFLDLPAPWEALKHLTRSSEDDKPSALDPQNPVYICTFSPCIEQVQKTISSMRQLGWIEIETVELQHKRIDVRRDFTGLKYEGMRSVNTFAVDVDEALTKLRAYEQKVRDFHASLADDEVVHTKQQKQQTASRNAQQDAAKILYKEGTIVHRSEPELKTHTSYLVFALLPRDWTDEDEEQAREMLSATIKAAPTAPKSQRQLKKEAKLKKRAANGTNKSPVQNGTAADEE